MFPLASRLVVPDDSITVALDGTGMPIVPSPFRSWLKLTSINSSAGLVPDTLLSGPETKLPLASVFHTP